jgi:hypothetical protein
MSDKKKRVRPSKVSAWITSLLAGLAKFPSGVTSVLINGKVYQLTDVTTQLGAIKAPFDVAAQAERDYQKALQTLNGVYEDAVTFVQDTRAAIKPMIGRKSADLVDYGMEPDKTPKPLTAEQEVTKVAKGKATRKARGTLGTRQRTAIHGTLPEPTPAKSGA